MTIKFICPKGHQVVCADDKAGQSGKCPKCGARFTVPNPREATAPAPTEDLIIFLCPNGHKLNGPASLQGRPGQCPHCHAKFVIPDYSEVEGDDEQQTPDEGGQDVALDEGPEDEREAVWSLGEESATDESSSPDWGAGLTSVSARGGDEQFQVAAHPMAIAFDRLWQERRNGATIELQLKDGTSFVPDRFAEVSSQQDLGIFAVRDSDGTYMVSCISWDAVAGVSARRLKHLPQDMFG